ncbi:MAG: hypothetical protein IBX60_01275 [Candidatus Aminicenantes bacterium]|nr:hypothetical protein [Candidatus Aminicenantes bacterium]
MKSIFLIKQRGGCSEYRIFVFMPWLDDGIRELLFGRQKGLESFSHIQKTESIQLCLFDP